MKKKIKNEELYSRREFFKKAVKTALPIIATVVLVSNPVASKAAKVAMGCESYCTTRVRDKDCVKNRVKRAKIVRFTLC